MDLYIDTHNNTIMWEDQELSLHSIFLDDAKDLYNRLSNSGHDFITPFYGNTSSFNKTLDRVIYNAIDNSLFRSFGYSADCDVIESLIPYFKELITEVSGVTTKPEEYFN